MSRPRIANTRHLIISKLWDLLSLSPPGRLCQFTHLIIHASSQFHCPPTHTLHILYLWFIFNVTNFRVKKCYYICTAFTLPWLSICFSAPSVSSYKLHIHFLSSVFSTGVFIAFVNQKYICDVWKYFLWFVFLLFFYKHL